MNKERRKALAALASDIAEITGKVEDLRSAIEAIMEEEQESFDNMPESLQASDRGEASQEAISHMENAIDMLNDIDLDDVGSALDDAAA